MKKIAISLLISLGLIVVPTASAHVVVKPAEVGVASYQNFVVGVPVEKDSSTVGLRLIIPVGLKSVIPNVKPGWQIEVKRSEEEGVSEIIWTGGSIPVGQRDEFSFSAQVPAIETSLVWKAYQTYADGEVVAWVDEPIGGSSHGSSMPYSQTKVINDLDQTEQPVVEDDVAETNLPMILAGVAFVLSVIAVGMSVRRV